MAATPEPYRGAGERLAGWRARRRLPGAEMSVTEHIEELRYRVLLSLAAFAAACVAGWHVTPYLLERMERLAGRLIVVTPAEGFVTYLKMSVIAGLILASPVILAQAWLFVAPGLYPQEAAAIVRLTPAVALLFATGVLFGAGVIYPVALRFLVGQAGPGVAPALSVSRFLSFLIGVTLPFGIVFEMPAAAYAGGRLGILRPEAMKRLRRWAVLLAFVVGAVLTPPDVISQLLMAGPLVVLYEVSIWTAGWGNRSRKRTELQAVQAG